MAKQKKAQIIGEVIKYILVGVFSIVVLVGGYAIINAVRERGCRTEITKFQIDLSNLGKSLRFGAKELQSYDAPCQVDRIYFFDLGKSINPENFNNVPLIKDTLKSRGNSNVFLVKEGEVKGSFSAGSLEMLYPYYTCFVPKFDKISFFVEGSGNSAKITSACSQPECTFIPEEISEELSRKIIKEAVEFGCRNCPNDFDRETEKIKLTRQNVEILRKFLYCDGITDVQIIIRPKKGAQVKDFRFYEFIPKGCIDDLNKYLVENLEGNAEIKGDPLIMWYFSDLGDEKKISYKLSTAIDDECKQAIKGLGVAQFVESNEQKENQQIKAGNTPPAIGGLPDAALSGLGLKKNVIRNLWKYSQDKETDSKNLVYSIIDQTNSGLVECNISNEKNIDCNVNQNKEGTSAVTVQADDLEFRAAASFKVEVSPFCKKHARKECIGNQVFWFDSCQNQEDLHKSCKSNEKCEDGECEEQCSPNTSRKCDGDKIYWMDSCGKKSQLYYNCGDNTIRKSCRNEKCCIGNLFCKESKE